MQQQQHTSFTNNIQVWNGQSLPPVRYWYMLLSKGFTAIGKNNNDKTRPWFKRLEA